MEAKKHGNKNRQKSISYKGIESLQSKDSLKN